MPFLTAALEPRVDEVAASTALPHQLERSEITASWRAASPGGKQLTAYRPWRTMRMPGVVASHEPIGPAAPASCRSTRSSTCTIAHCGARRHGAWRARNVPAVESGLVHGALARSREIARSSTLCRGRRAGSRLTWVAAAHGASLRIQPFDGVMAPRAPARNLLLRMGLPRPRSPTGSPGVLASLAAATPAI